MNRRIVTIGALVAVACIAASLRPLLAPTAPPAAWSVAAAESMQPPVPFERSAPPVRAEGPTV